MVSIANYQQNPTKKLEQLWTPFESMNKSCLPLLSKNNDKKMIEKYLKDNKDSENHEEGFQCHPL